MLGTLAVSKFNNFDVGNLVSGIMEIKRDGIERRKFKNQMMPELCNFD